MEAPYNGTFRKQEAGQPGPRGAGPPRPAPPPRAQRWERGIAGGGFSSSSSRPALRPTRGEGSAVKASLADKPAAYCRLVPAHQLESAGGLPRTLRGPPFTSGSTWGEEEAVSKSRASARLWAFGVAAPLPNRRRLLWLLNGGQAPNAGPERLLRGLPVLPQRPGRGGALKRGAVAGLLTPPPGFTKGASAPSGVTSQPSKRHPPPVGGRAVPETL